MKPQISESTINYGDNKVAGNYAVLNGVKLIMKYMVEEILSFFCMVMVEISKA